MHLVCHFAVLLTCFFLLNVFKEFLTCTVANIASVMKLYWEKCFNRYLIEVDYQYDIWYDKAGDLIPAKGNLML